MPATPETSRAFLVPYHQDPFALLAQLIEQHHADAGQAVVLMPEVFPAARLEQYLHTHSPNASRATPIATLRGWIEQSTAPLDETLISARARQLMLVEQLMAHPGLFGEDNPWSLADSLLRLFDELTLHHVVLADKLSDFTSRLVHAYGIAGTAPSGLSREARLVHTLWQSWHEELSSDRKVDVHCAYLLKLAGNLRCVKPNQHYYLVGFHYLLPAERSWCDALDGRGQLTRIFHGQNTFGLTPQHYHPDASLSAVLSDVKNIFNTYTYEDSFNLFINSVYTFSGADLRQRAQAFAHAHPGSPAQERLTVFTAHGGEQEASAIALQVQRWLVQGKQAIGVVTEDRRLARRLRALLERADIVLQDAVGWPLSTTRAATTLERWLQTVEDDFSYLPLLDLLKSALTFPERDHALRLAASYLLERDVVLHGNIRHGLANYQESLKNHLQKNPAQAGYDASELLHALEHASTPLLPLLSGNKHLPETLLNALQESLHRLGMTQAMADDAAGKLLVQALEDLRHASSGRKLRMTWREFRRWLAGTLEAASFSPGAAASPVQLMTLAQSSLCRFDALVIAGADYEHLPGSPENLPFFNQGVRHELGLPTAHDFLIERFHHFRRLLESAPQILVTTRREQDGEEIAPSPWLESLQAFHFLAYGNRLEDSGLVGFLQEPRAPFENHSFPASQTYPRPGIAPQLVPKSISAHAYQQLMDCPYQFFAARCLKLAPMEMPSETLEKSDYGQRVHRCLQAFHQHLKDLPGPFTELVTPDNRQTAIDSLEQISQAVFARDLENNILHRAWLKRWKALIPAYIDWQMERAFHWKPLACEMEIVRDASVSCLTVKGRLDRMDYNGNALAIIDYKTGDAPAQADVDTGEAIQLPFYTLLTHEIKIPSEPELLNCPTVRVEYLLLNNDVVKTGACLEGEALTTLRQKNADRLTSIMRDLANAVAAPAWGDETTCTRCDMSGLCRKQAWALDKAEQRG
jgi:ATP-dependent helicase/nuclease subunit B